MQRDGARVLVLPSEPVADTLRELLRDALPVLAPQLAGAPVRLDLGTRPIELFEVRRLLQLLREPHGIEVTGLVVSPEAVHHYAEHELKLTLHLRETAEPPPPSEAPASEAHATASPHLPDMPGLGDVLAALVDDDAPAVFDAADAPTEEVEAALPEPPVRRPVPLPDLTDDVAPDAAGGVRTLTVRRTVRSGTELRYDRDIVVLGDVNAGCTVRAGGNVLVMGRLRGVVHAGFGGAQDDAFILAFDLAPTQLRIGDHIAIAPARNPSAPPRPEIAFVRDGAIVIEPWTGRLPR